MTRLVKIVQGSLGVVFLGSGSSKLAGTGEMVDDFDRFRYPPWFRVVTGAVEVGGALGLLVALFRPVLTPPAGLLLGATMAGALATHAKVKDPAGKFLPPAVMLLLVTLVGAKRQQELRHTNSLELRSKPSSEA